MLLHPLDVDRLAQLGGVADPGRRDDRRRCRGEHETCRDRDGHGDSHRSQHCNPSFASTARAARHRLGATARDAQARPPPPQSARGRANAVTARGYPPRRAVKRTSRDLATPPGEPLAAATGCASLPGALHDTTNRKESRCTVCTSCAPLHRPRPDKRSAKVIELRIRREARNEARKPQPPDYPSAA